MVGEGLDVRCHAWGQSHVDLGGRKLVRTVSLLSICFASVPPTGAR